MDDLCFLNLEKNERKCNMYTNLVLKANQTSGLLIVHVYCFKINSYLLFNASLYFLQDILMHDLLYPHCLYIIPSCITIQNKNK